MEDEEETLTIIVHKILKHYLIRSSFIFVGIFIWFVIFALFLYWKSFIISYLRKDEKNSRPHYYLYIEYKSYWKNIAVFTFIGIAFNIIVLFMKEAKYMHFWGFIIFFTCYILYCFNLYYIKDQIFDLFDDYIWIIEKCKKREKVKYKTE